MNERALYQFIEEDRFDLSKYLTYLFQHFQEERKKRKTALNQLNAVPNGQFRKETE